MCGFAGVVCPSGAPEGGFGRTVHSMAESLRHRGPDDAGVWVDEAAGVALGFRRLAVLETSEAGHQPMVSRDGRLVLAFNGEIYNHADLRSQVARDFEWSGWHGHSDAETLLACCAAWGIETALARAVGMFAIALWERQTRRLFLARDRFGEKPLYYGWTRGAFVFGSDLAALRRYPQFDNAIDRGALALYLAHSHVPAPYSIYSGIHKLQPGCLLTLSPAAVAQPPSCPMLAPFRDAGMDLREYWSLAQVAERGLDEPLRDENETVDTLHAALGESVRVQSHADVPVGALLSGGIDSSLIVALMQAHAPQPVKTFTIGFHEARYNEAPYAKAVAAHLGTAHAELHVSAQQAQDVIPDLPRIFTEPFADASEIPTYLVARLARDQVTVALSGDGGDELFGGYPRHYWWPSVWNRIAWLPTPLRRRLSAIGEHAVPPGSNDRVHRLAEYLTHAESLDDLYRHLVTAWVDGRVIVPDAKPLPTALNAVRDWRMDAEPAHRMMFWDGLTYLPDEVLHKVDRATMAVALESRAPFLDHRVAELAWRLPLRMKVRHGKGKWILRQLLQRYVPRDLIERGKQGFDVPLEIWLRGSLREWAEDLLSESTLRSQGYLNPTPIRRAWMEHVSGRRNWRKRLWTVLMFQAWLGTIGAGSVSVSDMRAAVSWPGQSRYVLRLR